MKFMTIWSVRPGDRREAIDSFLAGKGAPPKGYTLLGRWHRADCSGGFTLVEADDPTALYEDAAFWSQYMDLQTVPVAEDGDVGPILMKLKK